MRTALKYVAPWLAILLMAGCSTPAPYIPKTVGPLEESRVTDALEIRIEPDKDIAYVGEPIRFKITIRNAGQQAFWVPRDPDLLFTWTYADGIRDNFVHEFPSEHFYSDDDAVLLKPGETILKHIDIKTYYFATAGITEFRAFVRAGKNTNPSLAPFWEGRGVSNSYGVVIKGGKKKYLRSGSSSADCALPRRAS